MMGELGCLAALLNEAYRDPELACAPHLCQLSAQRDNQAARVVVVFYHARDERQTNERLTLGMDLLADNPVDAYEDHIKPWLRGLHQERPPARPSHGERVRLPDGIA